MLMVLAAGVALAAGAPDAYAQKRGKPTSTRTRTAVRRVSDPSYSTPFDAGTYGNPAGTLPSGGIPDDPAVPLENPGFAPGEFDPASPAYPMGPPPLVGTLRVTRLDLPFPDENAPVRKSGIEVRVPPDARAYLDGKEMECHAGVYRYVPKEALYPWVPYVHNITVERFTEDGGVLARTITIYMRPGRMTLLTFE
jgi:hypothetical protein